MNVLLRHADRMATDAKVGMVAIRNLLVAKGAISEEDFDGAVKKVEAEQVAPFTMAPEIQEAREQIRRVRRGEQAR